MNYLARFKAKQTTLRPRVFHFMLRVIRGLEIYMMCGADVNHFLIDAHHARDTHHAKRRTLRPNDVRQAKSASGALQVA
ncbi:MAG: hypothetical protein QOG00_1760 [Pyrinomonadaceae bacterium]|nr:hypothetical protein [Pyrinomonadaceae bacterium]MDX6269148.1 hypothetical protein [Acidobacteriota bacterium]